MRKILIILAMCLIPTTCFAEKAMVFYKKIDNSIIWTYTTNDKFVYTVDDQLNEIIARFGGEKSDYGYGIVEGDFADIKKYEIINGQISMIKYTQAEKQAEKNKRQKERDEAIAKLKALGLLDKDLRALGIR